LKRSIPALFCLAIFALALNAAALAAEDVTLKGSFVWAQDDGDNRTGDLTAILTPDGENQWSVAFHFMWEEEPHTYLGTATGSLTAGALEGTAEHDNEDHEISFRFSGTFEDGTFAGTHGWVNEDGTLEEAGTLTLAHPE